VCQSAVLETSGEDHTLVTYFHVEKNQTIDAYTLQTWRPDYLHEDDVFHVDFLKEIIFGGVQSNDVHLEGDTEEVFKNWKTQKVRYEPHMNVDNGPYYVVSGFLHSVWRVYEDRQLAFLQAIWPSIDEEG
jgi:hypothetical protein